jgi:hypothetical protein
MGGNADPQLCSGKVMPCGARVTLVSETGLVINPRNIFWSAAFVAVLDGGYFRVNQSKAATNAALQILKTG